jgi:hypothetical protein
LFPISTGFSNVAPHLLQKVNPSGLLVPHPGQFNPIPETWNQI